MKQSCLKSLTGSIGIRVSVTAAALMGALISLSAPAVAGWSSGGGELLKDARNPWFLHNTKEVTYCIEIDEKNFGLNRARVTNLIEDSIDFWKKEFRSYLEGGGGDAIGVGGQKFTLQECHPQIDLRFKFGVLTREEEEYLQDPRNLVGVTVRTDYDEVNLRGKGFIYISPQSGPLQLSGENLMAQPWSTSKGNLLRVVLAHELGHVFGVPHSGGQFDLMAEGFPELLVSREVGPFYASWVTSLYFFQVLVPQAAEGWCMEGGLEEMGLLHAFFVTPKRWECLIVEKSESGWTVSVRKDYATSSRILGEIVINGEVSSHTEMSPLIKVYYTARQKVFDVFQPGPGYILGPSIDRTSHSATYRSIDKKHERMMMVATGPEGLVLSGALNGMIRPNLAWTGSLDEVSTNRGTNRIRLIRR